MPTKIKRDKTGKPEPFTSEVPSSTIMLVNPVAQHFPAWIAANAIQWQGRAIAALQDTLDPESHAELVEMFLGGSKPGLAYAENQTYRDFITPFAQRYVVQQDSAKGQHLVLCGAGPSLAEHAAEWCPQGGQVWGCNSALTWLAEQGHKVTHGFAVDQTAHMCAEWATTPDVSYLLASTVHPHLADLLAGRPIQYFHNFVGINEPPIEWPDDDGQMRYMGREDWYYSVHYPPTIRAGSGLNAVTRALDVAQFMGFDKITVLGADCALRVKGGPYAYDPRPNCGPDDPELMTWLREHTTMHADGGHALASEATSRTLGAVLDGEFVLTKPDMALTAQWMVRMVRASEGKITLIGDTLPNRLMSKGDDFLARLPNLYDGEGRPFPVYA
jgi:hypothetical protein